MTRRRRAPYYLCRYCRAPIRWVETSTGDVVPLNLAPADDGDHVITAATSAQGRPVARVLTQLERAEHAASRYSRHRCRERAA